jgi:hypothetical protein
MRSRPVLRLIAAAAFAAALLVPTLAAAQGTALGAKVGYTSSSLSFEESDEFNPTVDARSGMLVGVTFRKDVNARAGVQVEGVYAQGGGKFSQTFDDGTFRQELKLHQIQIPVLVTFNAMTGDTATVRVFAGLTFSMNVDEEFKTFFNDVEEPADEDDEDDVNINTGDTGFTIGGMVDFKKFFVDVRYTIGINNINGGVQLDPDEPNVKTRQFAVAFGFYFR